MFSLLATIFFPDGYGGGPDSAHHSETLVQTSLYILICFEIIPLIRHGSRPIIQKKEVSSSKTDKMAKD